MGTSRRPITFNERVLIFSRFFVFDLSFIFVSTIWFLLKMVSHMSIRKSPISYSFGKYLWIICPAAVLFRLLYRLNTFISAGWDYSRLTSFTKVYWAPVILILRVHKRWPGPCQLSLDSYVVPPKKLEGGRRLLEVDNRTPLPHNVVVRAIVKSADVLHSWASPSLGVKVDGRPGQALPFRPTSILNIRGRSHTPLTFTGDYWAGIEHKEIQ